MIEISTRRTRRYSFSPQEIRTIYLDLGKEVTGLEAINTLTPWLGTVYPISMEQIRREEPFTERFPLTRDSATTDRHYAPETLLTASIALYV